MRFPEPPLEGRFLRRYKRFFADVELPDGEVVTAHCPNTGGLLGCLQEGAPAWLRDSKSETRKLRYTWQAIRVGESWVNVDTSLPNRVVAEAIEAWLIPAFRVHRELRSEVPYGDNSRIDLLVTQADGTPCYIEVKTTTLAEDGVGLFPDAVTERGRKHLGELARLARKGIRAVQFFCISRSDVNSIQPADRIDREYGKALRRAIRAGVEVHAWSAIVTPEEFTLTTEIPFELPDLPPPPRKKKRSKKTGKKKASKKTSKRIGASR